ncbi:hypothetical protein ONZ45_g10660 [Pleurotus djamor]|nr:hypothetical protein ONZ45_g10660 [Pleurotus djamor]
MEHVSNREDKSSSNSGPHHSVTQEVMESANETRTEAFAPKMDSDSSKTVSAPETEEDNSVMNVDDHETDAAQKLTTVHNPSGSFMFTPLDEVAVVERYPEQSDLLRERFLKDGAYHQLLTKLFLTKSPAMYLATAKFRQHFLSLTTPREVAFIRENGSLAIFTCFGEIASPDEGTVLSAKGNHFTGPSTDNFKFLTDESKCKNILVLRRPSLAPPALHHFFGEQIRLLETVISVAQKVDDDEWRTYKWIRSTSADRDNAADGIIISTPRIYAPPPHMMNFRSYHDRKLEAEDVTMGNGHESTPWHEVREGAFYDPSCLSDYGGPYFKLQKNKLAQQNFYDVNNNLIPPWQTYDKLRTGTLVVVNVALSCYFYTVKLKKLRVLAESDEPVHMRYVPGVTVPGQETERKIEENGEVDDFRAPKRHRSA